jgi:transmembrane sensor
MSGPNGHGRPERDEQAAAYLARLLVGADEADQRQIAQWTEADPRNAVAFARAEAAWEAAERLRAHPLPLDPIPSLWSRVPRREMVGGLVAAGAVATMAGAAWVYRPRAVLFRTGVGEQRGVTLADGSKVQLNTASAIKVALRKRRREVRLVAGEAHFTVAHDPGRPFVVSAQAAQIRAVGTAFNVRLRPDVVELTVTDGLVSVSTPETDAAKSGPSLIPAGEGAVIGRSVIARSHFDSDGLQRRTDWQRGVIEFDGETLDQVVEEFNRYRAKPIVIDDPALADIRVGGRFELNDSDKFLAAVQSSFPIDVIHDTGGGVLLTPRRGNSS